MNLDGEYTFRAPQDLVWQCLLDPVVLAAALPGCEKLELVGENEYEGALNIKIGPVQGTFQGKVKLEDIERPTRYTMQVDGRGAPGFVKATAHLELESRDGETHFTYTSRAQVGGRIASVGQRLIESSAKAITKQSLEGLNTAILARVGDPRGESTADAALATDTALATDAASPSQAQFAAAVAKEVAKDLVPRWVMVAAAVVILMVIGLALF